jgi:hypothetical protein
VDWTPCSGAINDAEFPVLVERPGVAFGHGDDWLVNDTLVIQHSVMTWEATCTTQRIGLVLGTSTPGCAIDGELYVDRAFGTAFMRPTTVGASCAAAP